MGFPVSPVIANIYMEYLIELALGPNCPIPTHWWKRYMDDIISIVKKVQEYAHFNHWNLIDPHIKFTMETSGNDDSIHSWIPNVLQIQTIPYKPQYTENQPTLLTT